MMDKESQKIFEALWELHDRYDEDPKHTICGDGAEQIKKLCEKVDALKQQVPQWISVKDKLPESHKNALVIYERKDGLQRFGVGFMDSSKNWYIANGKKSNVLYWMPFPQPPKEETHE